MASRSVFFVAPFVAFSSRVFTLFGHEPELVVLESSYFRICLAATAVKMTATALGQFLLAINRPWIVLLAAFSSIFVNVGANWLLIYGHWGFPAMGVAGAAWGTNLAVTWEVLVLAAFAFGPRVRQTFNTLDWLPRLRQMKTSLRVGRIQPRQNLPDLDLPAFLDQHLSNLARDLRRDRRDATGRHVTGGVQ